MKIATTIDVRGPLGVVRGVPGIQSGAWAAHRSLDIPEHFVLTLLPLGLMLPPDFATFLSLNAACNAVNRINRLRNDWSIIEQSDLTIELRDRIKKICTECGAIKDGPVAIQALADVSMTGRGQPRLNNFTRGA